MARTPHPELFFSDGCSDCAERQVELPAALAPLGDDFDWLLRDYDSFRLFMMEELAARFPERRRWTPADMEVVIVETLAVVLDQLSDQLDRTLAEAFLETARRPASVRRLLSMIGYDAVTHAAASAAIPQADEPAGESPQERRARLLNFLPALRSLLNDYATQFEALSPTQQEQLQRFIKDGGNAPEPALDALQHFLDHAPAFVERARHQALERYWSAYPHAMDASRSAGPHAIHTQRRMVTEQDYAERMEEHPLVLQGHAFARWSGSWNTLYCALILRNQLPLDTPLCTAALGSGEALGMLQNEVNAFYRSCGIERPDWAAEPTPRTILRPYLDAYRMAAQEVFLLDAEPVGINIALSLRIAENYYQSEIRRQALQTLGSGLGGFFEAGRRGFGEGLYASDIIEALMALDGVKVVCLNRFKRVGKRYPNQADSGHIRLEGLEVAVCDNRPSNPERGLLRMTMHGGQKG